MAGVNTRRVLGGGLLAGLVMNVGEVAIEPLLASDAEAWLGGLGLPAPGEAAMLMIVISGFVLGIITVWLYAALRPRYGPGARTALMTGLVVAILACLIPNIGVLAYGILTPRLFWLFSAWALIQVPLATLAGAWAYRETAAADAFPSRVPAGARG